MDQADRRKYAREYQQKRRILKKEKGECCWCKNPSEGEHRFCMDCLEKGRLRAQERTRKRRAARAETTETTPDAVAGPMNTDAMERLVEVLEGSTDTLL